MFFLFSKAVEKRRDQLVGPVARPIFALISVSSVQVAFDGIVAHLKDFHDFRN